MIGLGERGFQPAHVQFFPHDAKANAGYSETRPTNTGARSPALVFSR